MVDTERRHFLLTQQHAPMQGRCPDARAVRRGVALRG